MRLLQVLIFLFLDVSVTTDLKNTPCAPNDYFQLDCNTCYCNSAKTGYLCTDNICPPDNTTETSSTSSTTENATVPTTPLTSTPSCITSPVTESTTSSSESNSTEAQQSLDDADG